MPALQVLIKEFNVTQPIFFNRQRFLTILCQLFLWQWVVMDLLSSFYYRNKKRTSIYFLLQILLSKLDLWYLNLFWANLASLAFSAEIHYTERKHLKILLKIDFNSFTIPGFSKAEFSQGGRCGTELAFALLALLPRFKSRYLFKKVDSIKIIHLLVLGQ